jgi:hypothetical protein
VGQVYFGHPSAAQGAQDTVSIVHDGFLQITVVLSCRGPQENIRLVV